MESNLMKGNNKDKGKSSDNRKGKGESGSPKAKDKGKVNDKGKRKGGAGKALLQFQRLTEFFLHWNVGANTCTYCGETSHWQRDCHKNQRDTQPKQVPLVQEGTSKNCKYVIYFWQCEFGPIGFCFRLCV